VENLKGASLRQAPAYSQILDKPANAFMDEHSSLSRKFIKYVVKKYYNIEPRMF